MPSSLVRIFSILCSEVFFCDIHPTDDRFYTFRPFIEEPDFRVIILFEIFTHDKRARSYKNERYIFHFEEFLCSCRREYISSHSPESEEFLRIVYTSTESIFTDIDIDIRIDLYLLQECLYEHPPHSIISPHESSDMDTIFCLMDRTKYLRESICSIDDESDGTEILVFHENIVGLSTGLQVRIFFSLEYSMGIFRKSFVFLRYFTILSLFYIFTLSYGPNT